MISTLATPLIALVVVVVVIGMPLALIHFVLLPPRESWEQRQHREASEAQERRRRANAAAKAAGCKCGRPATHVRRYGIAHGVPFEVWSCEEHQNVNGWAKSDDGPWEPTSDIDAETEKWRIG